MTPERWRRADQLFQEAATLAPGEQDAWLERECQGGPGLKKDVRELLNADARSRAGSGSATAADAEASGKPVTARRAGPYRLTREIGRGGMGSVYLGERDDGQYEAEVAVKLIRPGLDAEFFFERFRRERHALGRLQHPNIARIFDSGTTDEGEPYIVMELIHGVPITVFARQNKLTLDQILSLYLEVCRAVSHAHQKLVVHRDLKPGNILVQEDGTPKLLDFGICKLMEDAPPGSVTNTGTHLMTPEYASPEQVRGRAVTASSDIYSLGAVLYELLTGRPPHIIARATPAALVAVCEEAVPAPSRVAKDPSRAAQMKGLLDAVVLKALEKDPERRYHTVDRLAEDLRRVLNRETALAPTDPVPVPRNMPAPIRRYLLPVTLAMAVLIAGAGWTWRQRAIEQSKRAQAQEVVRQADQLWNLQTRASVTEARALGEAALRLDPGNPEAHNLIAQIYNSMLMWYGGEDLEALERKVREEASAAIRLAPKSERAWTTWVSVALGKDLNLAGSVRACGEALAALPRSVSVLAACSRIQSLAGNPEIALMLARQLEEAKPETSTKWMHAANIYFRLGRTREAEAACAKSFALRPKSVSCTLIAAHLAAAAGQPKEGLAMLRAMDTDANRRWSYFVWAVVYVAARSGDEKTVSEWLERDKQSREERLSVTAELAARLGRGEHEKALDLLEAGVAARDYWALEVLANQVLSAGLAANPRYQKLLDRLRTSPQVAGTQ